MRLHTPIALAILGACLSAQGPRPGTTVDWSKVEKRIAWFGTWTSAKAAAAKLNRPILLVSAAPHCRKTPGVW